MTECFLIVSRDYYSQLTKAQNQIIELQQELLKQKETPENKLLI